MECEDVPADAHINVVTGDDDSSEVQVHEVVEALSCRSRSPEY